MILRFLISRLCLLFFSFSYRSIDNVVEARERLLNCWLPFSLEILNGVRGSMELDGWEVTARGEASMIIMSQVQPLFDRSVEQQIGSHPTSLMFQFTHLPQKQTEIWVPRIWSRNYQAQRYCYVPVTRIIVAGMICRFSFGKHGVLDEMELSPRREVREFVSWSRCKNKIHIRIWDISQGTCFQRIVSVLSSGVQGLHPKT